MTIGPCKHVYFPLTGLASIKETYNVTVAYLSTRGVIKSLN